MLSCRRRAIVAENFLKFFGPIWHFYEVKVAKLCIIRYGQISVGLRKGEGRKRTSRGEERMAKHKGKCCISLREMADFVKNVAKIRTPTGTLFGTFLPQWSPPFPPSWKQQTLMGIKRCDTKDPFVALVVPFYAARVLCFFLA